MKLQKQIELVHKNIKNITERERELFGSWVQVSCIWNSWSRVRGSEAVAWRRAGSSIHSWYFGTCASMYGTIITFFPSKLTLFFSVIFPVSHTTHTALLKLSQSLSCFPHRKTWTPLFFFLCCSVLRVNDCRLRPTSPFSPILFFFSLFFYF